jgi:MtN3 and saliva related transmembrane protein
MDTATLVGAAAAAASMASFSPQAFKVIRTRDTSGISAAMYALTVVGFALWMAYGLLLGQWPLIVTNGVCLLLAAFILAMKLMPPHQREAVADKLDPGVKTDA